MAGIIHPENSRIDAIESPEPEFLVTVLSKLKLIRNSP